MNSKPTPLFRHLSCSSPRTHSDKLLGTNITTQGFGRVGNKQPIMGLYSLSQSHVSPAIPLANHRRERVWVQPIRVEIRPWSWLNEETWEWTSLFVSLEMLPLFILGFWNLILLLSRFYYLYHLYNFTYSPISILACAFISFFLLQSHSTSTWLYIHLSVSLHIYLPSINLSNYISIVSQTLIFQAN